MASGEMLPRGLAAGAVERRRRCRGAVTHNAFGCSGGNTLSDRRNRWSISHNIYYPTFVLTPGTARTTLTSSPNIGGPPRSERGHGSDPFGSRLVRVSAPASLHAREALPLLTGDLPPPVRPSSTDRRARKSTRRNSSHLC